MTWFKVDDSFHHHRKVMVTSPSALGLWLLAGTWSAGNLTGGFVPKQMLPRLLPDSFELASELVANGLWVEVSEQGREGYQFHDWDDYQPDAEAEKRKREARREAGRKGGLASGKKRSASSGEAKPKQNRTPTPTPSGSKEPSGADHLFERFYAAYPRKVGRKGAERKWVKALKDGTDPQTLIAAAERYAQQRTGQDSKFTKHPSTWLNEGCWLDEDIANGGDINPDEVLGPDAWSPPTPPREVDEGPAQQRAEWFAARGRERKAERLAEAKRVLARRSA